MLSKGFLKSLGVLGVSLSLIASPMAVAMEEEDPSPQSTEQSADEGTIGGETEPGASEPDNGMNGSGQGMESHNPEAPQQEPSSEGTVGGDASGGAPGEENWETQEGAQESYDASGEDAGFGDGTADLPEEEPNGVTSEPADDM